MNYRHAFHAGNFADIWKHVLLLHVLGLLQRKDKPLRVIDTHAGAGLYHLDGDAAGRTGEWEDGVGRLWSAAQSEQVRASWPRALAALAEQVRALNEGRMRPTRYPGSPLVAAAALRRDDMLVANEIVPEVRKALDAVLEKRCRHKVTSLDAYTALKALLPPPERRGLILVDPPFEQPGEFQRMTQGLSDAVARFPTGQYLLWYPIKDPKPIERFHKAVAGVAVAARIETAVAIDLHLRPPRHPDLLNGCGVVLINPPYDPERGLERLASTTAALLAGAGGPDTERPVSVVKALLPPAARRL